MPRGRLNLIVLATLLLAAPALRARPAADSAAVAPDSAAAPADSAPAVLPSPGDYLRLRERFAYPRTTREDPFNLPFSAQAAGPGYGLGQLELCGVLHGSGRPGVAIFTVSLEAQQAAGRSSAGGQASQEVNLLLREGDYFEGAQLVAVRPGRVVFRVNRFGRVSEIVKELKPLTDTPASQASAAPAAGGDARQSAAETDH